MLMHRAAISSSSARRLIVTTLLLSAPRLGAQAAPTTPPAGAQATPGATPAGAVATTAATTTTRPPRESWTSDRRNYAVGDLVTVLIDDYTISTALKENVSQDMRTRGLSANARLPIASGSNKIVGLDTRNSADQQQRGSARRENRFQNELSVRVIAVAPNGLLQLKGTKNINIDKSGQDVVFTGYVRPQDISITNTVESNRIADAQLGYLSPGPLGKPKQGMLSKILGAFWP